jgi:hypothetical protein
LGLVNTINEMHRLSPQRILSTLIKSAKYAALAYLAKNPSCLNYTLVLKLDFLCHFKDEDWKEERLFIKKKYG